MSILSRFGIGSATIDLIPENPHVQPGGHVDAHLEVSGGATDQHVADIEVAVVTRFRAQREDDSYPARYVLWETEFKEGFTVASGVERSIDVPDIRVPPETPITWGDTEVWIQTGLDIEWALDPSDEDQLEIAPGPRLKILLEAVESIGFDFDGVSNEEVDVSAVSTPFVQRFAFASGPSTPMDGSPLYLWPLRSGESGPLEVRVTRDERAAGRAPVSVSVDDDGSVDGVVDRLREALRGM